MRKSAKTIALAGNPNCGKTTIFNKLTGSRQRVGNYPGVTVEKKEGYCRFRDQNIVVVDLPGTYSLTAFSPEEVVTRNYIASDDCDVLVSVVDASNLERNLYLATQLLEMEKPVVLALNMIDVAESRHMRIAASRLAVLLDVPVVKTVGSRTRGMSDLLQAVLTTERAPRFTIDYGEVIERQLAALIPLAQLWAAQLGFPARWLSLKLLENDEELKTALQRRGAAELLQAAQAARAQLQSTLDEDIATALANLRYQAIAVICRQVVSGEYEDLVTISDRIDALLTNRWLGLPIFFAMMWLVFNLVFTVGDYPKQFMEAGFASLGDWVSSLLPPGELSALVVDGMIGGVGSVLVFLPNIILLFLAIALLEDTGYMARAAFLMDRAMAGAGLHGKSFIPLLIGFGCNVPAIMGTRTLENPRDRLITILILPLMSCSARLPVYTVLIGAFFSEQAGNVLFSIYVIGILLAVCLAKLFRLLLVGGGTEPFVMELPPYRVPSISSITLQMWERCVLYVKKAGTIILAAAILVWFSTSYPQFTADSSVTPTEAASLQLAGSYAGRIGRAIEPVIAPLGFDWRLGVSLLAGFSAKEVVVSTMSTMYRVGEAEEGNSLSMALAADPVLNPVTAYALMIFTLVYSPCLATLAVIRRETGSWRWALFSAVYTTSLAWLLAFVTARLGAVWQSVW